MTTTITTTDAPRLEVSTRAMPANCDLSIDEDGTVLLVLRDGMLPRATVYELGVLLSGVRVASLRPWQAELADR